MARRLTARPSSPWAGDLPVDQRVLANGLKALVLPRKHAPVVVCDIYYPVGSFNEPAGRSGLAHFVEHMLFKGTERLPKGQIDRIAFAAAGQANAETGEDSTHYWFAFPRDRWELALQVESDRMLAATFEPDEVEAERRVIIEERARDQESPFGRLDQAHLLASYARHPYRNPILGWPDDLERIGLDDLAGFYRTHYRPDGAVLVVVGDVDPARALDRIEGHFASLPKGKTARDEPTVDEPRQTRPAVVRADRARVDRPRPAGMAHGRRWDIATCPALDVLADLLTCGRRSRLWDRLVERGKVATWVDASQEDARRGGQLLIQVEATPGVCRRAGRGRDPRRDPRARPRRPDRGGTRPLAATGSKPPGGGSRGTSAAWPRARRRRALGRLGRVAGHAPRGARRRRRRHPPRRLDVS